MEWLTSPETWIALLSLTALEIVLGVDNIIFISILVGRLPPEQRNRARLIGLGAGDGDAHRAAAVAGLDDAPDRPAVRDPRARGLRTRPDPDRRRPLPARQVGDGDPQLARG